MEIQTRSYKGLNFFSTFEEAWTYVKQEPSVSKVSFSRLEDGVMWHYRVCYDFPTDPHWTGKIGWSNQPLGPKSKDINLIGVYEPLPKDLVEMMEKAGFPNVK